MRLTSPRIRLVNKQLKDPTVYIEGDLEGVELTINYSVRLHELKANAIVLFMHIALRQEKKDLKEAGNLLHTDYMCVIHTQDKIDPSLPLRINKKELAHYFGICIIMIRGSLMTMLQYHPLDGFMFPVLNPTELLEKTIEVEDDNFVLEYEV